MTDLKNPQLSPSTTSSTGMRTRRRNLCSNFLLLLVVPLSVILHRFDDFDPAPMPEHSLSWAPVTVSNHNSRILEMSERIGEGRLDGPEDLAYDPESGFIYTTNGDGWIKRVKVTDSGSDDVEMINKVENWVHIGGRPLGLVFGPDKQLIIAESFKGLFKVTKDGEVELLTDEADGLKFKLADGVDVAKDGMIYFTDTSYRCSLTGYMSDVLDGRPYGRFMSYNPSTKETQVLVQDLYFPNGVAVSPKNDFVVYCETFLRSCSKYYIQGEKKGSVEIFVDNLPGYPDNIRYDGEGRYWIALPMGKTFVWDVLLRYPFVRKITAMLAKVGILASHTERDGGVLSVDLDGKMVGLYTDSGLTAVTGGIKIRDHLYYGSLIKSYISRLDLTKQAAAYSTSSI